MATHMMEIELDDDVREAAERAAKRQGTTLNALVEEALREVLNLGRDARTTGHSAEFSFPTSGEGGLMPGVDVNNNASLYALLDSPSSHS